LGFGVSGLEIGMRIISPQPPIIEQSKGGDAGVLSSLEANSLRNL
jgi:hypothetical protein